MLHIVKKISNLAYFYGFLLAAMEEHSTVFASQEIKILIKIVKFYLALINDRPKAKLSKMDI